MQTKQGSLERLPDVLRRVDADRELYAERLAWLCGHPAVSATGEGIEAAAGATADLARDTGASAELVPTGGAPVVWIELDGEGPRLINLYNHYDTQPAGPRHLWGSPPFVPTIRGGAMFVRGVADNRSAIVARLCAVEAVRRTCGRLPIHLRMVVEGEEEIGSPHLREFVDGFGDRLREADGWLWEQSTLSTAGRCEQFVGLKGILYLELTVRRDGGEVHSGWSGVVPSPAWRLVALLGDLRSGRGLAQVPGFSRAAADVARRWRRRLSELPDDAVAEIVSRGTGSILDQDEARRAVGVAYQDPSINIAGLTSGYAGPGIKTSVPVDATAKVDIRLVPGQDPHELEAGLRGWMLDHGYDDVECRVLAAARPAQSAMEGPLVDAMVEAGRMVGLESVVLPRFPGSGPMHALCDVLGLPVIAGEATSRVTSNEHGPDEHVHLDDFHLAIKHLAAFILMYSTSGRPA